MSIAIHGARCAIGPNETIQARIEVAAGRITGIQNPSTPSTPSERASEQIDLSGFLLMPGLINAHDHLQFALFPRLANPPYQNYIDWGEDIHRTSAETIALHKTVPRYIRLWWGGLRNLLCGVTTVCHHDPLWPELTRNDFPVRVLQQYGWAHSLALGGDIQTSRNATPAGCPFIMHAGEGVDTIARMEIFHLERMGLLDSDTVLVHALAFDPEGAALLRERNTSIILCPSSNHFLFVQLPPVSLLSGNGNLAIGSDSPLTAMGDLLDEVHFATHACGISPQAAYRMVTDASAAILHRNHAAGSIAVSGAADLIAVRDKGGSPAEILQTMSAEDVELVMIRGRVQLASNAMLNRFPTSASTNLEPLSINGSMRWLRAPVNNLMEQAENVLGRGNVRLAGKSICALDAKAVSCGC